MLRLRTFLSRVMRGQVMRSAILLVLLIVICLVAMPGDKRDIGLGVLVVTLLLPGFFSGFLLGLGARFESSAGWIPTVGAVACFALKSQLAGDFRLALLAIVIFGLYTGMFVWFYSNPKLRERGDAIAEASKVPQQ